MQHHLNKAVILLSVGLLLLFISCRNKNSLSNNATLVKTCEYLWNTQSEDGGWHSSTHAIMRDGESLTPFILTALLKVPENVYPRSDSDVAHALDFIRKNIHAHIELDTVPVVLDYPNYTAAYALKVLVHTEDPADSIHIRHLTEYLVSQQFVEHRGIDSLHPAYGGWGFGETNLSFGTSGHVDISHTRRVLEALRLVLPPNHPVFTKAQVYLRRVQNLRTPGNLIQTDINDGGFFTSIVTPETNKSLYISESRWGSYATATCDGLLAIKAAGISSADSRFVQAAGWLDAHKEMQYPEGIPLEDPMQWHRAMKYYHLAVRTETCAIRPRDPESVKQILSILKNDQRKDGSFMNPMGGPNKEDDPLLATALALIAMSKW